MTADYDLIVIGAGSAGLTAAEFAAQVGARVALVERGRVGGDCTWTGCVPSKALVKVARVAHAARTAARYGLQVGSPVVEMTAVRDYLRGAIDAIYQHETPDVLRAKGIDVVSGAAQFLDPHELQVGPARLTADKIIIATGARPFIPLVDGLSDVPFVTYEQIFDNDRLPEHLLVLGAGPTGLEIAQAYRRLGAAVTVVAETLLPDDDPEARQVIEQVLHGEGVTFVWGTVRASEWDGRQIRLRTDGETAVGDMLLVAAGRQPNVDGLGLEAAGVAYSDAGIGVDAYLRTSAGHIFAAGDCTGGPQFTHYAGWQAFQAARNALFPLNDRGVMAQVPRVTFTDPEVAQTGLTETAARQGYDDVRVARQETARIDRAVCEDDLSGFIKIIHRADETLLGATIVAERAGELLSEFVVAMQKGLKLRDLAEALHAYPTYGTAVQLLAADFAVEQFLASTSGRLLRRLARLG